MKKLKKTGEYSIFQKRSGRYAVRDTNKQWIHGEDKTKLLLAEGLIQIPEPKPAAPPETPAEEAPEAAAAQTESDDAPVEKASAETQAEEASQEAEPADTPEETPAS